MRPLRPSVEELALPSRGEMLSLPSREEGLVKPDRPAWPSATSLLRQLPWLRADPQAKPERLAKPRKDNLEWLRTKLFLLVKPEVQASNLSADKLAWLKTEPNPSLCVYKQVSIRTMPQLSPCVDRLVSLRTMPQLGPNVITVIIM